MRRMSARRFSSHHEGERRNQPVEAVRQDHAVVGVDLGVDHRNHNATFCLGKQRSAVTFVISGTASFCNEHGDVTHAQPGCQLNAPAGFLHRELAGSDARIVIGTNLPYSDWTMPIDKDPADRPVELTV